MKRITKKVGAGRLSLDSKPWQIPLWDVHDVHNVHSLSSS